MGEELLKTNTPSGEISTAFPKYEELQKASWDVLEQFKQTASVNTALGQKYAEYDSMTLFQLRDALFLDSQKKHKGFMAMYNSVNDLLNLSVSSGRYFDDDGNGMTKDFFETLFTATTSVNQYLATHSGYRWQEKGERRVQIATRISHLLKELANEVQRVQSTLPEKKARMVNYAKEGLSDEEIQERERLLVIDSHSADLIRMVETGEFGSKKVFANEEDAAKKWIINGYSAEMKKRLETDGALDGTADTRDDFAAFITDQNNRLIANRMAVSIIIENDKEATLGMPWIESELKGYLLNKIDREKMLSKTSDFVELVRNAVESFKQENKERLTLQKTRIDMLSEALYVPAASRDLYNYSVIKELITESDDEVFKEKLAEIRENVKSTDKLIKNYLDEHFSEATRNSVAGELYRFLGAYRIVATPSQIMNRVGVFCDMIKYTAPKEYIAEQSILNMMKDLKIDEVRRDHFVRFMSDNKPARLMRVHIELLRKYAEKYADNVRTNSKSFTKLVDAKGCYLCKAQWDEIEKLNLMSGEMKNSKFKAEIEAVTKQTVSGQKLSRREYLTERRFMDAQNEPERIKRAQHERELIEKIGDSTREKFLLDLAGNGENIYSDYIKLDAAYKGTEEKLKKQMENEEKLATERTAYLKHALQRGGVPNDLWPAYISKLDYLLRGISESTSDMTDDERLYAERMNLERFGVKNLDEALDRIEQLGPGLAKVSLRPDGTLCDIEAFSRVREKYNRGCDILKSYDGGKYAEIAELLVNIPEVFGAVMKSSGEEFDAFIKGTVDVKLGSFLEGIQLAGNRNSAKDKNSDRNIIPGAVLKQYAYSYIRSIYDGSLTGDAAFFKSQLEGYSDRVFKVKPNGERSIADNIRDAEKTLDRELDKLGKKGAEALGLKFAVLTKIYDMANDTKEFQKLMDNEFLSEFAIDELKKTISSVKDNKFDDKVRDGIVKEFTDSLPSTDEAANRKKEKIRKIKASGTRSRIVYLGMNDVKISDIRLGKSLVRVAEKGKRRIKLGSSLADDMRGRIQKYCSSFDLPPVLVDALVEEGSSEAFTDRVKGIMWDSDLLQAHAFAMNKLNSMLMEEFKDDTAMSPEEAQMYIIRLYGNPATRELFEKEGGPDVAALRTSNEYRLFRRNYEKLTLFEGEESNDPLIERERMEQSKNLRTMLITGVGVLDKDGNDIDSSLYVNEDESCALLESMGDIIDRNKRYLDYSARLSGLIRRRLEIEKSDKEVDYSDRFMDMKIIAIRDFLMKDFIKTIESDEGFDEQTWVDKLERIYGDPDIWENIVLDRNSVSEEMYRHAEEKKFEHEATKETIAEVIDGSAYLFRDRANSYKRLDEDQRKLFALALIVMDKGAIGYGTQGSMALIHARSSKVKEFDKIQKELDKYVSGQPIDLNIDYKEALNKLLNYGETKVFYMEEYTLSTSAYDKALSFVNALTAKKVAFMAKDYERLGYGYESINTAFVKYGKEKQLNEVDKLRDETITMEDVRTKLIEYAGIDTQSLTDLGKDMLSSNAKSPLGLSALDRYAAHRVKMNRIKTRLQGMSPQDLKMFVRIMQERSVIDKSRANTGDGTKLFVDQEKRNALIETLSSDSEISASVLEGFDDTDSCYRVLVNALSFQLRDDIDFRNKDLTKDHFVKGALNRTSLADWDLVESAFELLDEIRDRRASIYALSHAADFIEQSGNMKAIQENRKLESQFGKNKKDFTQESFEKYIKQQSEKDNEEDVKRAVAGYHALSEREKNLFFTVLSSRDLLDISRKDYKKSFFGIKDRNYINQAGRDKLIDRYIESSLEGNVGITIGAGIHYNALKMLFSTQISDRERFDTDKNIESMMSVERNFFMGRATAIDWKLFKRALNFVNRASEELEYVEGNAQLYRGAGDLWEQGRLDISYSFLRKNFHRTGNQWGRYLGRLFVRNVRQELHVDILDTFIDSVTITDYALKYMLGLKEDGLMRKGLVWVKNFSKESNQHNKALANGNVVDFKAETLTIGSGESSEKTPDQEEQRRAERTYYQSIKEGIDDIFAQGMSISDTLKQTKSFLRERLASQIANHFEPLKFIAPNNQVKATVDKNNLVEKYVPTTGKEDNRTDIHKVVDKTKENAESVIKFWNVANKVPGTKNLTQLIKYTAEKAAYNYAYEKLYGKSSDLFEDNEGLEVSADQQKLMQDEIDEYVSVVFRDLLDSTIGEKKADDLLLLEQSFYAIKSPMAKTVSSIIYKINYAKKCVNHVENISSCINNRNLLSNNSKNAKNRREEDNKKLARANEKRLSAEQAQQVKAIVDKHRGMADLSGDLATAIQDFNIAGEVVNSAIETATVAGGKLNLGQYVISRAIKEGLQFAMFALRVASDRKCLADYYLHTKAGKSMVGRIRGGFSKAGNTDLVDQLDNAISRQKSLGVSSLVDIISDARGYEHSSELVENTAMSMAQSIVFCASNFNPMTETKLMAITVMSVMGLGNEIGSTSPSTVEKLSNCFRTAR